MATTKTKKKVPIELNGEALSFIRKVAKMSGLTLDDVVSVIIASYLARVERDKT